MIFHLNNAVWYTSRAGGTWQSPVQLAAGSSADLAVSANDVAHVVYMADYYGDGYLDVIYTNNAGGEFPATPPTVWNSVYNDWGGGSADATYYYAPVIATYGDGSYAIAYRLCQMWRAPGWTDYYGSIHVYRSATNDDLSSPSVYMGGYPDPQRNGLFVHDEGYAYLIYGTTRASAWSGTWQSNALPTGSGYTLAPLTNGLGAAFVDGTGGIAYLDISGGGEYTVLDATTTGRNPVMVGGPKPFVVYEAVDSGDHEVWLAKTSNEAPVLGAVGNKTVAEGSLLSFTLSATDGDGDALTYSGSNLPAGAAVDEDTGAFTWTPGYDQAGTHADVVLRVSDGVDTDSETITITVDEANAPPVLAAIGDRSVDEGATLSFTLSATDQDGDGLTFSASGLPAGATLDGGTGAFSWTPGYDQAGGHAVTFTVTDDGTPARDDSETVTITANDVNRAPVLGSVGNRSTAEGTALSFTVAATDADGDGLTYSATGLPAGATLDAGTGAFSWTPGYDQAGDHSVTFSVADDGSPSLGDSETVTIGVSDTNRAPVLATIGNQTVAEGATLSFTVWATDPDGHGLTYSAAGLPAGAIFDAGTGGFSWTPGYDQAGAYPVTFTVADDGSPSLEDSESITITVGGTNRAPALGAIGDKSVDEGSTLSFTLSATDPDLDVLGFSASNLPPGASFDGATGAFSWTPGYDQAGTFAGVQFSVTDGAATDSETITITVGDVVPPALSIGDAGIVEGNSGSTPVNLTVTLSPASANTVTVGWSTSNGTAGAGDFVGGFGQLTFLAGETSKTITVNVTGDTVIEADETFTVTLASPTKAVLGDDTGVVRILNDDSATQAPPFGAVDTPAQNATGIEGAIAVTGWALDDTGVLRVVVSRDPVAGEPAGATIYVGDAVFVDGARPDVAAAYPTYPASTRAGWGYMLLTNMLPNHGNGTYKLWLHAVDREGRQTLLGSRTFTCANAAATLPFGTLDTPAQGATVGGKAFVVFGWALTPVPGAIPTDGSTIWVYVDGVPVGHPVYDQYRADIATLFPGYANSNGAIGYYVLDTTTLSNGMHSIAWLVTDDQGRSQGIGSRYFWVANLEG